MGEGIAEQNPLTDLAWSILKQQPVMGEHVFGRDGKPGFTAWCYPKRMLEESLCDKRADMPFPCRVRCPG
jgi:hypothetical protein